MVTGGTSGIGYETVLALARLGADVLFTGRSASTGSARVASIVEAVPSAAGHVSFGVLDLADLESVSRFSAELASLDRPIDVLVLNAGAIGPGSKALSPQGVELTFATNHLGHFALVKDALPLLKRGRGPDRGEAGNDATESEQGPETSAGVDKASLPSSSSSSSARARVVLVSSIAARSAPGTLARTLLGGAPWTYHSFPVYGETKLANQLYARKLQALADARGWDLAVEVAHPGGSATGFGDSGGVVFRNVARVSKALVAQPAWLGAQPTLRAALDPNAKPLEYFGPRWFGLWGAPVDATYARPALDEKKQNELWKISEQLAGAYPQ